VEKATQAGAGMPTGQAVGKRVDGRESSDAHLPFLDTAAKYQTVNLDVLQGAPIIRGTVSGRTRIFLIDTGSSISLIQPAVCAAPRTPAEVTPFGVTGEELEVQGSQVVEFELKGNAYSHVFTVCKLATEADAILGTDFLNLVNAKLDMEVKKMWLLRGRSGNHEPLCGRSGEGRGVANRTTLTVLTRTDERGRKRAGLIGCKPRKHQSPVVEKQSSLKVETEESEAWLIKAKETVKIPPRVKEMVVGRVEFRKLRQRPELVCAEPAQLPFEGVLAARGVSPVLPEHSCSAGVTSRRVDTGQLRGSGARQYVHVMLVNFSQEEITITKATVLVVAEEISPNLVAAVNDEKPTEYKTRKGSHSQVNTVKGMAKMRSYIHEALSHL
jgi:hypothetical protein